MSHIPNSAMPHAGPTETTEPQQTAQKSGLSAQASKVAELARGNPKTAVAAGAAVIAGIAAAAAIPLVRGRKTSGEKNASGKSKKSRETA